MNQYTPMIQQYLQIKLKAKEAIVFFRLGDFYEMFFEDAVLAARELEITLTAREGGGSQKIPMCGVPHHSSDQYINKLIGKGYKVAICEQMEDPAMTKGMVRRDIVRIVTPGTVMQDNALVAKNNNYMLCLTAYDERVALCACDVSTGELYVTSMRYNEQWITDEMGTYDPAEVIGDPLFCPLFEQYKHGLQRNKTILFTPWTQTNDTFSVEQFGEMSFMTLTRERQVCVSQLMSYLYETQKRFLGQLTKIISYETNHYMVIDPFTRRNLELVETVRERSKKGSLLSILDRTETAMGGRLLRRWMDKPLLQKNRIEERLEAVDVLYHHFIIREDIRCHLKDVYDLERLVARISFGNANARDLHALRVSLQKVPFLRTCCQQSSSLTLQAIAEDMDDCQNLCQAIRAAIVEQPPVSIREGGMICTGYDDRLDELREASTKGKDWISELEIRERELTGIRSLKVGYNKVFGYFIEITKSNVPHLKEGRYERKQTLANAERYVTPELKQKEALILEAHENSKQLEYTLFTELLDKLHGEMTRLKKLACYIAQIDVYQALATVSADRHFVKPIIGNDYNIIIQAGRHPVVETVICEGTFIANDTQLTQNEAHILLITGPNMAGKSTYMRQIALICILAQMGCFVPAQHAELAIKDRIFTRIGAADDLIGGQSTFMVEMADIQLMTEKATRQSLIIIDELGRGTSTQEGMAIAQSVIEYVHHHVGCKALISTHFHELSHLEKELEFLKNYCMAVHESEDQVHFLRKLVPGAASSSYGIYCAKLAGLPDQIIERANDLLQHTTQKNERHDVKVAVAPCPQENMVLDLNIHVQPLIDEIKKINVLHMTPLQAMQWLHDFKTKAELL